MFLDTLEHALEDVVDYEEDVSELIHNPRGSLWNDANFQNQLSSKLGRGYGPFFRTMRELSSLLELISNKLGLESSNFKVCELIHP